MALIKCEECGKEINSRAPSCPNCGIPIEYEEPTARTSMSSVLILFSVVAIAVISILLLINKNQQIETEAHSLSDSPKVGVEQPITLTKEEKDFLARAATSILYSQDIEAIGVYKTEDDTIYTEYTRLSDGTIWKNKFRIEESRIRWGNHDGRWRDHSMDERILFVFSEDKKAVDVSLTYDDGSSNSKTYRIN